MKYLFALIAEEPRSYILHMQLQVLADVISIVTQKIDIVTLDICTCLLPLLTSLLESDMDR